MKKLYLTSDWQYLSQQREFWKKHRESVVFSNGCFDGLHEGHEALLEYASGLGDHLLIGLNSDASVRSLKGAPRPLHNFETRAGALLKNVHVDAVVCFNELTPAALIALLKPDVLVKGGDYSIDSIVGADTVLENGGRVEIFPRIPDYSTTAKVKTKILKNLETI